MEKVFFKEIQVKTSMRYHYTSVIPAKTEKIVIPINSGKEAEKRFLMRCWWECKMAQPLWKIVLQFLKKLGISSPNNPAVVLLDIYLRLMKT